MRGVSGSSRPAEGQGGGAEAWLTRGALVVILLVMTVPFLWMLSTSLRETFALDEILREPIPLSPTLKNYVFIMLKSRFPRWLWNSLVYAGGATVVGLLFDSMAAYVFARKSLPGLGVVFFVVLGTMMIPFQMTMLPLFIILRTLGGLNTYWGLILPNASSAFGIFLLTQFIRTLPRDLDDAARIDGCGDWHIYWRIIMPLCKPAVATLTIFTFLGGWNDFLWPLIVTNSERMRTLTVGLQTFSYENTTNWGLLMAGACFAFLPLFALFLALQRYFVKGIVFSGLKG